MATVMPIIEGKVKDAKCIAGQIPFQNLDHQTDCSLVLETQIYTGGPAPNNYNWGYGISSAGVLYLQHKMVFR